MIGFISGAAVAVVLAIGMWAGMSNLYVPTEVHYGGEQLHLDDHLIEETVGGD